MEIIVETEIYKLFWEDAEKTILRADIEKGWTWDDAHLALSKLDECLESVEHDVYTVYLFKPGASTLPPKFAMSNIKSLLGNEQANEKLVIFVGAQSLIASFINMVTKVYGSLTNNAGKMQFTNSLDEAYHLIEATREKSTE